MWGLPSKGLVPLHLGARPLCLPTTWPLLKALDMHIRHVESGHLLELEPRDENLLSSQGLRGLFVPVHHPEAERKIQSAGMDGIGLRSGPQLGSPVGTGSLGCTSRGDAALKSAATAENTAKKEEEKALL